MVERIECTAPRTVRAQNDSAPVTAFDVARAWAQDRFEVWYQPQHDLRDGRLIGAEALVRMRQEDGSVVGPADFLHHVSGLGLMTRLGEWVLATALSHFAGLAGAPTLSVNVCASQLAKTGAGDALRKIVRESGFPSALLTLEVTEEHALSPAAIDSLEVIFQSDVRLSIDDFGTGYSGLQLLSKVVAHEVKLDRSLVQRMHEDRTASVCRAVVALGEELGMDVVAEGLEDQAQVDQALAAGCIIGQGFHFAKAMPFATFADLWISEYLDHTWLGGRTNVAA